MVLGTDAIFAIVRSIFFVDEDTIFLYVLDDEGYLKMTPKKMPLLNATVLAHRAGDVSLFGKQGRAGSSPLWLLSGGRSRLGKCHAATQFPQLTYLEAQKWREYSKNIEKRMQKG